jgi:hypothetical protein
LTETTSAGIGVSFESSLVAEFFEVLIHQILDSPPNLKIRHFGVLAKLLHENRSDLLFQLVPYTPQIDAVFKVDIASGFQLSKARLHTRKIGACAPFGSPHDRAA